MFLNYLVGSLFALAAGRRGGVRAEVRSAALQRCVLVVLVAFMPFALYYVIAQPAWSWMFVLDPEAHSPVLTYGALVVYLAALMAGFFKTSWFLERRKITWVRVGIGTSLLAMGAISLWGWDRLFRVGSYTDYHSGMSPSLLGSTLGYVLIAMGVVFIPALVWALKKTARAASAT